MTKSRKIAASVKTTQGKKNVKNNLINAQADFLNSFIKFKNMSRNETSPLKHELIGYRISPHPKDPTKSIFTIIFYGPIATHLDVVAKERIAVLHHHEDINRIVLVKTDNPVDSFTVSQPTEKTKYFFVKFATIVSGLPVTNVKYYSAPVLHEGGIVEFKIENHAS